jgi:hypothetical protein
MPTCFVVMGFGKKTDYPTGRILDLDKSYTYIIKPAAKAAGYECTRADEIQHAGNINVPMYQQLLSADVVIADVSTYNANAFYELGVRHALKPHTTITIAEDKIVFPFDVAQIAIRKYHHLGEGIDFGEVERMRADLQTAITVVGATAACDSPVYTFLHDLQPPAFLNAASGTATSSAGFQEEAASQPTVRALMDQADAAFKRRDFVTAKSLLGVVLTIKPMDSYVTQKLVLATYKSELPSLEAALNEALAILESLRPATSTDAETLGLYGAIQKRLWSVTGGAPHLDKAIWAHEKGFNLRNDYYNGINLAFLLNVRAALKMATEPAEAIADFVVAQRARRQVQAVCEALLASAVMRKGADEYWIRATLAEVYVGFGETAKAEAALQDAKAQAGVESWMIESTEGQFARLKGLLAGFPLQRLVSGVVG